MRSVFTGPGLAISNGPAKRHKSAIEVDDLEGKLVGFSVEFNLAHEFGSDVNLTLVPPWGRRFPVMRRGLAVVAPFERLSGKNSANGVWQLVVDDVVEGDGGTLGWWELHLHTHHSSFNIELDYLGGLTHGQHKAFEAAVEKWRQIIIGDLPEAVLPGGRPVDDVLIFAEGKRIDGPGRVLGQAGPSHIRDSGLTISGSMRFDTADLAAMEDDGSLVHVITHEMGHVLGIGTLWRMRGLVRNSGTSNPVFVGEAASKVYGGMIGKPETPVSVPIANTGGRGTREAHWRESVFDNELMTGWIDAGANPMSRLTVASLQDLGYVVDLDAADQFALPIAGLSASARLRTCCPASFRPEVVPT